MLLARKRFIKFAGMDCECRVRVLFLELYTFVRYPCRKNLAYLFCGLFWPRVQRFFLPKPKLRNQLTLKHPSLFGQQPGWFNSTSLYTTAEATPSKAGRQRIL